MRVFLVCSNKRFSLACMLAQCSYCTVVRHEVYLFGVETKYSACDCCVRAVPLQGRVCVINLQACL